jgi:G3E family GTPase
MADVSPQIPVTGLTGYLGFGKTTLLNRILPETHGKRFAVIVNEFGEVGIDNDLIVDADEEIFEMNNGCICCTVRGDLVRIIAGLMRRNRAFDGIVIETTGLADPAPVAQTFFVDEDVRKTKLDAIITVADAWHLLDQIDRTPEAQEQLAFAEVVFVNKVDLVDAGSLATVERVSGASTHMQIFTERSAALSISPRYLDGTPSTSSASSESRRDSSRKNTSTNTTMGSAASLLSRTDR